MTKPKPYEPTNEAIRRAAERLEAFVKEFPILRPVLYGRGEPPVSRYGMAEHDRRMDRLEHDS